MKYKKIERTLEEAIEFFDKLDCRLSSMERKVITDCNYIDEYLKYFEYSLDLQKMQKKIVNFFWEKLEEEIPYGTFCKFWNKRCKYPEDYGFYGGKFYTEYIKMNINGIKESMWDSCEPVNEIPKLEQGK
jgi:hypothetical protein